MHGSTLLIVFFGAAAIVLLTMSAVARSTTQPPEPQAMVTAVGYRLRRGWLWVLSAAVVAALLISIPSFPYGRGSVTGVHFTVRAYQFAFIVPPVVPLNVPVVFDVSSSDVNHGFGIYDPHDHLMAQVQAMPNYVNHLPLRFREAGHYTIRCMEFCGIAHASMQGGFDVR